FGYAACCALRCASSCSPRLRSALDTQALPVDITSAAVPGSSATLLTPSIRSDPARATLTVPVPALRRITAQPAPAAAAPGRVSVQRPEVPLITRPRSAAVSVVALVRVT